MIGAWKVERVSLTTDARTHGRAVFFPLIVAGVNHARHEPQTFAWFLPTEAAVGVEYDYSGATIDDEVRAMFPDYAAKVQP